MLKACPFCGSRDVELRDSINNDAFRNAFEACCNNCGGRTGLSVHREDVVDAWNRRAHEAVPTVSLK